MSRKKIIMLGMLVGSLAGGYAVTLFGASGFGFASLFGSTVGAVLGIWVAFRMT